MLVTFQPLARQKIDPVRRTSITSVLLILVFATSTSACVAEWGSQPATSCPRSSSRRACVREKPGTAMAIGPVCGHVLKSVPGKCGLRSFVHFQFVAFHKFEISAPLRRV